MKIFLFDFVPSIGLLIQQKVLKFSKILTHLGIRIHITSSTLPASLLLKRSQSRNSISFFFRFQIREEHYSKQKSWISILESESWLFGKAKNDIHFDIPHYFCKANGLLPSNYYLTVLFICKRICELKFLDFCPSNRIAITGRKCQKVQVLLLFCRYSTSYFLKFSAWILCTRSQSTTYHWVKMFVKIICCICDKLFLHLFDGKYRSSTTPLVSVQLTSQKDGKRKSNCQAMLPSTKNICRW